MTQKLSVFINKLKRDGIIVVAASCCKFLVASWLLAVTVFYVFWLVRLRCLREYITLRTLIIVFLLQAISAIWLIRLSSSLIL